MKKLKFLKHRKIVALALAAVLTITSASGYTGKGGTESKAASTINLNDGLVVHYTFDDNLDNSASASGSAAELRKGSEAYTESLYDKAFDFSGNTGSSGNENASVSLKPDTLPKTTAFSVNYWIKGGNSGNSVIMVIDGCWQRFTLGTDDTGHPTFEAALSDGTAWANQFYHAVSGSNSLKDGWQMVTYTVSETGKTKIYVNGVKQETSENADVDGYAAYKEGGNYLNLFSDTVVWDDVANSFLGSYGVWNDRPNFSGQMDEFRMYERALNDDEIKALAERGIGVTPATGIQKEEDVYKITSDKLSDGSVDLKNVFSSIQTVNIDEDKLNELNFGDVTFSGTGVSGTTVSGLNDELVHEVTCKYSRYQLTLKLQAITKVACTKLEVKQGDKDVTSLELPKKGVDVVVTATGSESAATTEEISATATGCTATKKGEETKAGNKTSVTYTIEPTADAGSVTFTCGEKMVTVTTSRTAKTFTTKGVIDLDFESSDTAGDEKYTEDGITYTLTNNTEVVANPDDVTDSVLKTTATGYLDSVESILNGIDFSNGVTFTTKIRPEKQDKVWDYVFSLGTSSNAYNYVDGTMGFYMRAGDPYFAYCFFDSTATWAEGNTVGSSDTYFMQEANCNKWYTLTYTYDESAFCVYLDGVPIVRTNASAKADIITSILSKLGDDCKFSLGCGISRTFEKTPAYYDDTKVFNTALSADEVAYLAALGKAEDLTSDVYEDNAAKDAIKSAVTTAKATIKDDETVATDTLQAQTTALKAAITANEGSLKIKTYKITATAADSTFTYETEADFDAVQFGSDVVFKVNPSAGYSVDVKIDGEAAKPNLAGQYKILNVRKNHTVEVTTSAIKYPLITYVDGEKTEKTFKITDAAKDGNVTLPDLGGKNGWFTSATEKDPSNATTKFLAANHLTDEGITVYAYTKYKITLPSGTSSIDGGTVNTLPNAGKDYYLGDTVQIVTTPDSGKAPSAEIEDATGKSVDTWVTESEGKQILNFTMPASNVTVKSISFVGVSNAKLTELLNAEKALYDSANATTTEGLTTEYTVDSWNAYTSAYDAAKEVADAGTESKTQAQIDAAANALKEAKAALVHTCAVSMASTLKMEKEEQRDAIEVTVITNGEDKSVTWSSSNEEIVKVNAKTGALAAYDSGTAEITATAADGSTATCTVSVAVSPTAIKLKNCEVLVGATRAMKVTVTPEDASLNGMKWSSSDTSVATVDENGVVKGLKTGETTITATVNGLEESCTLTVINHLDNTSGYHVQLSPGIELGKDPVYMTFKSKTNATGTANWSTPRIGIYTGDTPVTDQTYCLRADLWADAPGGYPALTVENLSTIAPDWDSWLAKCKEGVDCYVSAVKVSNGVKIRMFVGDVSEQAVIPVEGEGPFYLTLTGGLCDITDIKVVPREEYREPSPYVPVYPVYPGSEVTPRPAITPGPEIDVPIVVDNVKADETLIGTGWWTGTSTGQNYALSGTDTSMVLYVGASKLDVGGYGAFNIELVSDGKYLTTGSDKNAWYAEGATGGELNAPLTGSVLQTDHVYRITITRKGNDITVNYYDATTQEEYYEVTATNINFGENINVHVMAQVGTFKIGQEVEVTPGDEPTSGPDVTSAPDVTTAPTAAPSSEPSKEPDVTTAPTKEPEATQPAPTKDPETTDDKKVTTGTKVTVSGTTYKVAGGSKVSYTSKKKVTVTVTIPATVKVNGKTYKVTSIAANAFAGNKKMKKVTVGKNIDTIGKNAFKNCKKLKTIVIKSTKLKASKIGKNAFSGIAKNAVVKVPKSKVKAYTKLLRKKGLSKKVKVKAI